jgi:hypothetical protein
MGKHTNFLRDACELLLKELDFGHFKKGLQIQSLTHARQAIYHRTMSSTQNSPVVGHLKLQAKMRQWRWEVVEKAVVSVETFSTKGNWR